MLESELYCAHLVERLRWAVEDATDTPFPEELNREHG